MNDKHSKTEPLRTHETAAQSHANIDWKLGLIHAQDTSSINHHRLAEVKKRFDSLHISVKCELAILSTLLTAKQPCFRRYMFQAPRLGPSVDGSHGQGKQLPFVVQTRATRHSENTVSPLISSVWGWTINRLFCGTVVCADRLLWAF